MVMDTKKDLIICGFGSALFYDLFQVHNCD